MSLPLFCAKAPLFIITVAALMQISRQKKDKDLGARESINEKALKPSNMHTCN